MAADAQPSSKPHKLTDGGGLYLLVNPNGSRYWRFRYRFNGKQNTLSCGVFPEDTLGEARARRDSFRAMLAAGVNPSLQVVADKARALAVGDPRFTIDNTGTLAVHLGKRVFALTAAETSELRAFLDATRTITGETPCP